MTNRRVAVTVTFATDLFASDTLAKVVKAVNEKYPGLDIQGVSASAFTIDDDDPDEPICLYPVDRCEPAPSGPLGKILFDGE